MQDYTDNPQVFPLIYAAEVLDRAWDEIHVKVINPKLGTHPKAIEGIRYFMSRIAQNASNMRAHARSLHNELNPKGVKEEEIIEEEFDFSDDPLEEFDFGDDDEEFDLD